MIPWIKNHPAQTAVLALTLGLAASSFELYREYAAFQPSIPPSSAQPIPLTAPEPLSSQLDSALQAARDPARWEAPGDRGGRLFAAKPYVAINGKLQRPEGKMFHPPVPNDWLLQHGLNPLDPHVLAQDPDADGFATLHEWEGMDALSHLDFEGKWLTGTDGQPLKEDWTSPISATAHPPYHTRLFVERIEQIPFHLRFLSHDVNPKNPREITVQINAVPGRTEFIAVGDTLKSAPFTVKSFTAKQAPGNDGTTKDVSEVVVVDRRSGQEVTLPKRAVVNSPESYALLRHEWTSPKSPGAKPATFRLRRNETFQLPPTGDVYRVTGIDADRVEITSPSGEKYSPRPLARNQIERRRQFDH